MRQFHENGGKIDPMRMAKEKKKGKQGSWESARPVAASKGHIAPVRTTPCRNRSQRLVPTRCFGCQRQPTKEEEKKKKEEKCDSFIKNIVFKNIVFLIFIKVFFWNRVTKVCRCAAWRLLDQRTNQKQPNAFQFMMDFYFLFYCLNCIFIMLLCF